MRYRAPRHGLLGKFRYISEPPRNLDLVVSVLLVDCETVPPETHNTTLSPACAAAVSEGTPRMCLTHCHLSDMPPGGFSATELVQIAVPARSTGFSTFSGSLGSAKTFRGQPARPAKGASKSRTSGQLFSAASRSEWHGQRRCV
jgi:hypothetical protein